MSNLQRQKIFALATHLSRNCRQRYKKSSTIDQTIPRLSSTLARLISCTKKTGSEILKKHFTQLLNTLNRYQDISISGPIACFRRGKEIFSRLLSFNTWLASVCLAHKRRFIDNFNVFWNCADRFKADGLHPNRRGSRLLTANISHALLTTSNSQNQASLPIPAVPKTDTSQTSSHGTEQNIQTASRALHRPSPPQGIPL